MMMMMIVVDKHLPKQVKRYRFRKRIRLE